MTRITSRPSTRRRRALLSAALVTAGTLALPVAASAAQVPLDLQAYTSRSLTFTGESYSAGPPPTGENAGAAIAGGCDVTGDRVPDLIVGAPSATVGGFANAGRVYVVPGRAERAPGTYGLPTAAGDPVDAETITIEGSAASNSLGAVVACAGDVNGDEVGDLIAGISSSTLSPQRGAYVVFGGADLVTAGTVSGGALGNHGFRIWRGGRTGLTVAGVGDVDDDGKDDVAVGNDSALPGGWVAIVAGRDTNTDVDITQTANYLLKVRGPADALVGAVARGGDYGSAAGTAADGVGDLLIGAPGFASPAKAGSGAVFVVSARARGDLELADWATNAEVLFPIWGEPGAAIGGAVTSAGDADGDGIDDIAIGQANGAQFDDGGAHRAAWVVYGKRSRDAVDLGALGSAGYEITGKQFGGGPDYLGTTLAGLGDVDGDGDGDIALGAKDFYGDAAGNGAAYVVYGRERSHGGVRLADLRCEQGARLIGDRTLTGIGASVASADGFTGAGAPSLLAVGATVNANEHYGNFARVIPLADVPGSCGEVREPEPTVDLDLDFGFRENFRGYVFRGFDAANPAPPITATDGASCDVVQIPIRSCDPRVRASPADPSPSRALRWTPVGAGATDGSDTTVATIGMVTFRFPAHFFVLRVRDPWVVISGGTATLRARVTLDVTDGFGGARPADVRVDLGTYPLAGAPVRAAQFVQWRTEPGTLTDEAWAALGGSFLGRGAELDPITLAIPRSLGALPEEPTVPVRRDPAPVDPPRGDPPREDPPRRAPPSVAVASFTAGVRSATVRRATTLELGTVACRVLRCRVTATRAIRVRVGRGRRGRAKFVVLKVSAPATLASGRRGRLRLTVSRAAAKALAGRTARLRVKLAVSGDGRPLAKTVTVTLRGARPSSTARRR